MLYDHVQVVCWVLTTCIPIRIFVDKQIQENTFVLPNNVFPYFRTAKCFVRNATTELQQFKLLHLIKLTSCSTFQTVQTRVKMEDIKHKQIKSESWSNSKQIAARRRKKPACNTTDCSMGLNQGHLHISRFLPTTSCLLVGVHCRGVSGVTYVWYCLK